MGFGSVIATALCVVVLIAAGYILISGITRSADVTAATMKSADDIKNRQLKTDLTITGVLGHREGNLSLDVNNVGGEKIVNITRMDVILKFADSGSNVVAAYWVPYRQAGQTNGIYWENAGISSITGDTINPGILDPGETMTVKITGDTAFPTGAGTVLVASPDGVSATAQFIAN